MKIICDIVFLAVLARAAASDWNTKTIKNRYPVQILALALVMIIENSEGADSLFRALAGAGISAAPIFLTSMAVRGAFGGGDIKLMAAAGCYLGPERGFYGLFLGLILASFYGIYLKIWKKIDWKETIPLGPFLALGLAGAELCSLL